MRKFCILFLFLVFVFLPYISSCNYANDNGLPLADPEITDPFANTQTNTLVEIQNTSTIQQNDLFSNSPEPNLIVDNHEKIRKIDDSVLVYQEIENGPNDFIYFSEIDFARFNNDTNTGISNLLIEYPISINDKYFSWTYQFFNNNQSFIYMTYSDSLSNIYLYKYNIDIGTSQLISKQDVTYAQVSPNESELLYINSSDKLYISDFSGNGRQYATDLYVLSYAFFSPNGEYIAFVGAPKLQLEKCKNDQNTIMNSQLFIYSIMQPENPTTINAETIQKVSCDNFYYNHDISWSPDSKEVFYIRENEDNKEIICKMNVISGEEICYSDYLFSTTNKYIPSFDQFIVVSGMIEPINHEKCIICTLEEINLDLFLLDLNTNELTEISDCPYSEKNPRWINNYQYIVYESYQSTTWQIFITDKSGDFQEQLTYSDVDTHLYNK